MLRGFAEQIKNAPLPFPVQGRKCFTRYHPDSRTNLHAPSLGLYRGLPAEAERACLRMLQGHVLPRCAAAFHHPRLSLDAPFGILSPSRHLPSIIRFSKGNVKEKLRAQRPPKSLFQSKSRSAFAHSGLGETRFRLPLLDYSAIAAAAAAPAL